MTENTPEDDDATKAELRTELRQTRSRLRALEAELAETNEGMVALTLELEHAKERYQTIFEESTDSILLIDPEEDTINEANPQACALLGYDRETLLALSPTEIFPEMSDRSQTFADAVVHGWADDGTCRTNDGRKIDVDISAAMVTLDGRSLLLASMRDITVRKRREQQLQVLTRIFRHNLRNDGNVIQGHADLLYDELAETELSESTLQIRETIDEILTLGSKVRRIQDVLDRDRIIPLPIQELLGQQRDWFEQTYPSASLSICVPEQEALVGRRLNVAIREVIDNAAKHASGARAVSVSVEVDDERGQVWFAIEDDGAGIPEHEIDALRSGGETPLAHGSGIGLWSAQWVVESLGGEVAIRRNESTGTTVTFSVPVETEQTQSVVWNRPQRNESQ